MKTWPPASWCIAERCKDVAPHCRAFLSWPKAEAVFSGGGEEGLAKHFHGEAVGCWVLRVWMATGVQEAVVGSSEPSSLLKV